MHAEKIGRITLTVPGKHNILNALAVLAALDFLGIDPKGAIAPLQTYTGAGRRFDIKYNENGILLVDDYGHHPLKFRLLYLPQKIAIQTRKFGQCGNPTCIPALWNCYTVLKKRLAMQMK